MTKSNVTNLNQFRKKRVRDEKTQRGSENSIKFGRTKAQRDYENTVEHQKITHLDGHKTGPDAADT